jgi:hypothetical protein
VAQSELQISGSAEGRTASAEPTIIRRRNGDWEVSYEAYSGRAQLNRVAGDYVLTADIVLTVAVENGRLFMRENDEEKQK